MLIIDAHAHIFPEVHGLNVAGPTLGSGYGQVSIGNEIIQLIPPYCEKTIYTVEMLLTNLDWAGIQKSVLLQGPFYGECNQYVVDAVNSYPDRLIGAAFLDPWDNSCVKLLDWVINSNSFSAVKLEFSHSTGYCGIYPKLRLDDPQISYLWKPLEEYGLVLVLDLGAIGSPSYQTNAVQDIAIKHPYLRIVICHLGQPNPKAESNPELWQLWQEQISLGLLPNVWFDCASLPAYIPEEDFPFPTAGRYLRNVIDRIGPDKVLWGTDQPGLLTHASLPQLLTMARMHTEFLSPSEQAMFLGGNADHVFSTTKH